MSNSTENPPSGSEPQTEPVIESETKPEEPRKPLTPAAKRALAEAQARREAAMAQSEKSDRPAEVGGPKGEEPTRYGDWERGGRAVDF